MERIDDILREMRTLGRLDEKSTDKIPRSLQALGLRTYADRIEAAAKREQEDVIAATVVAAAKTASEVYEPHTQSEPVGNAAAMREALIKVRSAICHFARYQCQSLSWENSNIQANCGDILCSWRDLCDAKTAINAALSAPPRNCDIPLIVDEAADNVADKAWLAFRRCNPNVYFDVSGLLGCIKWLFDEAKGEK